MAFFMRIKVPPFPADLRGAAVRNAFIRHAIPGVAQMTIALKIVMVRASLRVKATGELARSWQIDPPLPIVLGNFVTQTVKSGSAVALVWDKGTLRKNPRPPTQLGSPLRRWVEIKLGKTGTEGRRVAFKIASAIKKRGLPLRISQTGLFSSAAIRAGPVLVRLAQKTRDNFVAQLRRGR